MEIEWQTTNARPNYTHPKAAHEMSMIFPQKSTQIQAKTPLKIDLGQVLDSVNHKNKLTAVVVSLGTKS